MWGAERRRRTRRLRERCWGRPMPVLTPSDLVQPAMEVHSAAQMVVGSRYGAGIYRSFCSGGKEIILALSMGEPPPTEMRVSIDESLASSSCAIGACCLMFEKSAGVVFGAEKLFDLLDQRHFSTAR